LKEIKILFFRVIPKVFFVNLKEKNLWTNLFLKVDFRVPLFYISYANHESIELNKNLYVVIKLDKKVNEEAEIKIETSKMKYKYYFGLRRCILKILSIFWTIGCTLARKMKMKAMQFLSVLINVVL